MRGSVNAGIGVTSAATGLLTPEVLEKGRAEEVKVIGPGEIPFKLQINGEQRQLNVEP